VAVAVLRQLILAVLVVPVVAVAVDPNLHILLEKVVLEDYLMVQMEPLHLQPPPVQTKVVMVANKPAVVAVVVEPMVTGIIMQEVVMVVPVLS
tara:strand:- start:28 stop:306 length:279 start_codon:yes stop_codon:yes gene_type:complete